MSKRRNQKNRALRRADNAYKIGKARAQTYGWTDPEARRRIATALVIHQKYGLNHDPVRHGRSQLDWKVIKAAEANG